MGGHNAGDFASRFAINSVTEYIRECEEKNPVRILQGAIQSANAGIIAEAAGHEELFGMGTTLVALTVMDGYAYVANVGDSRLYVIEDVLRQVTKDHSLVEKQAGQLLAFLDPLHLLSDGSAFSAAQLLPEAGKSAALLQR
jgi:protein phosphatase